MLSGKEFLDLSSEEISQIIIESKRPKTGIFVPEGNRRLHLTQSQQVTFDDDFYHDSAHITTSLFKKNLSVFFSHGLQTLLVPLINSNVFQRNSKYQEITLIEGLKTIFVSEHWLDFYKRMNIRVRTYGNLDLFKTFNFPQVIEWIRKAVEKTAENDSHTLYYGIDSPQQECTEIIDLIIQFYALHQRKPTPRELIRSFYGDDVPPADFFIMSTKISGFGAAPPFIIDRRTQMYFLPGPGVKSLSDTTFRKILYDLLFLRPPKNNSDYTTLDPSDLKYLKAFYEQNIDRVIGFGKKIGRFWVVDFDG
ncbi:hypothetical protein GF337_02775 [candidate division KSB1 bacterium]|nr:hypothetical protein [candidate division KSB1 bacterium]